MTNTTMTTNVTNEVVEMNGTILGFPYVTIEGQSIVTDVHNPILNPNTLVIKELDGTQAFDVVNKVLSKFTYTQVGRNGIIILTVDGKRFGYYSNTDRSLTVVGSYANMVLTYTKSEEVFLNKTVEEIAVSEKQFKTHPEEDILTAAVENEESTVEELEMEQHYNDNYARYNQNITVLNMESERENHQSSFLQQTIQPQVKRILTVDGACSGNPGTFEFRIVWEDTKEVLSSKHYGHLIGTNNMAEVLGLATAIHHVIKNNAYDTIAIKYDSVTAKAWIDKGAHKITSKNVSPEAIQSVENALAFINANRELVNRIEIIKHDTKSLGEIAADFGRKGGK